MIFMVLRRERTHARILLHPEARETANILVHPLCSDKNGSTYIKVEYIIEVRTLLQ